MTIQAAQDRYYYAAQALFASQAALTDPRDDGGMTMPPSSVHIAGNSDRPRDRYYELTWHAILIDSAMVPDDRDRYYYTAHISVHITANFHRPRHD